VIWIQRPRVRCPHLRVRANNRRLHLHHGTFVSAAKPAEGKLEAYPTSDAYHAASFRSHSSHKAFVRATDAPR
jgi:hypothetical protein